MLVLSRKPGEKVVIGDNITLTVVEISGNRVRLGITAPTDVRVLRSELLADWESSLDDQKALDFAEDEAAGCSPSCIVSADTEHHGPATVRSTMREFRPWLAARRRKG